MTIDFFKYQGTGNDFILIDNRNLSFPKKNVSLISALCHRRFGIGADGLILIENHNSFDFEMVYFNSDGKPSSMCGNGGRCIVAFAKHLGIIENETKFLAIDGGHEASIHENNIHLKMQDVALIEKGDDHYFLDTGSPHYVEFVTSFPNEFVEYSKSIRYSAKYERNGVNVNLVKKIDDKLEIRTYERGVEDETYSCGTGAVAAALVSFIDSNKTSIKLNTLGGGLAVKAIKNGAGFKDIYLIGPAQLVFYSSISISSLKIK